MTFASFAIGIDLGTANTRTAIFRHDQFEMIPHEGQVIMPSYVAFTRTGRLIGQAAKNQASVNPENTICDALRFVGSSFQDPNIQGMIELSPFKITHDGADVEAKRKPVFEVMYKDVLTTFTPVEILAMILNRVKKDAEKYLDHPVDQALVTIPAYFNMSQRFAIKNAILIAGMKPLETYLAPTAALTYFDLQHRLSGEKNILVCDIGAAYYGVVLACIEEGIEEVKAVVGDIDCVGYNYDRCLMNHVMSCFSRATKGNSGEGRPDLINNPRALGRLRIACNKAKHQLSSANTATIEIEQLYDGKDLKETITRSRFHEEFEELVTDPIRLVVEPIKQVLRDAKHDKSQVHEIVLIGGSSRIPKIQKVISDFFNGKAPNRSLNPEEASARGAAIHASILSGDTTSKLNSEILLLDVATKSLGIETAGGAFMPFIKRGTTIPTRKSEILTTFQDNQPGFSVTCFEGERARVKDNMELGRTEISISPAPRGIPQLEVTFVVDARYNVEVSILDKVTRKESSVMLDGYNAHGFDRINQSNLDSLIMAEARMEAEDASEEMRIESRNTAEELAYSIKEWINRLPPEKRSDTTKALEAEAVVFLGWWVDANQFATAEEYEAQRQRLSTSWVEAEKRQVARQRTFSTETLGLSDKTKKENSMRTDEIWEIHKGTGEREQVEAGMDEALRSKDQAIAPPSLGSSPAVQQILADPDNKRPATPPSAARGMESLFDRSSEGSVTYTDAVLIQIATYLKNTGQPDWSKVPRLYTILRLINQLEMLDVFIQQGITDIWFPFAQATLPRAMSPSASANFLEHQKAVLSKSLRFEKSQGKKHMMFLQGEPLPYEVVGKLGAGAHGQVDKVMSTVSHREYARKLFRRVRGMSKDAIQSFLTELQVLKKMQHHHCIELVQSYTDPKYFALIMSPVADCNLFDYYSIALNDPDKTSLLRSFFGCLANALECIHSAQIRHRDIKPQNILVKGDRVFLTDFGIALNWEDLSRSTTTADSAKTWLYAAPEVAAFEKRNTAADIWSLGCVFMEMATTLKGKPVPAMRSFFAEATGNYRFYANVPHLPS